MVVVKRSGSLTVLSKMSGSGKDARVDIQADGGDAEKPATWLRICAALFYATSSFLIVIFNKSLLTNYRFPSIQIVGIGQMMATIILLYVAKIIGIIHFPDMGRDIPRKVWPLPIIYLCNLLLGLGSTKRVSLPMFTVLRRFTILFTLIAERILLGRVASLRIKVIVFTMLLGAVVAAINDLAFDLVGYVFILSNDVFTASYSVFMKKKINAKDLGKFGILFYNSAFMVIPAIIIAHSTGDFEIARQYSNWDDIQFICLFIAVCIMGFVLMYSTLLCTAYNSPLTTNITGTLKNLLVTYVGMVFGGDYIFTWANFIGLNISVCGSLFYTYFAFVERKLESPSNTKSDQNDEEEVHYQGEAEEGKVSIPYRNGTSAARSG